VIAGLIWPFSLAFLPVRASASLSIAISVKPSASSSSRYANSRPDSIQDKVLMPMSESV
jgi:hypothetical protein